MQLAKHIIDVRLSTNDLEPMLRFWQKDASCARRVQTTDRAISNLRSDEMLK